MKSVVIVLLSSFFLSGCIGTKHVVPNHEMPKKFEHISTMSNIDLDLVRWWKQFNDLYLNRLIMRALDGNYDLAIAAERVEASRAFYCIKRADLLPEIDVVGEMNRTKVSAVLEQTSQIVDTRVSFFQLGFDGSWELDFWGKVFREKRARRFDMQAQIEALHDIRIILIADVVRTYVDLCALNRILDFIQKQIDINIQLVALQQSLFDSGLSSDIKVAQREQQLVTIQDVYEAFIIERAQKKHQLALLLGENPEDVQLPIRDTVPFIENEFAAGLPSELLRRRPDIRQKERELAAANERIGQALAEWFPSFNLLGGLSSASSRLSTWFDPRSLTWNIGPSLKWPLLNFGRVKANIELRESEKREVALAYSQTIIAALKDVEDFLVAYFQNKQQVALATLKVSQAQYQAKLENAKFTSGLTDQLTWLEALLNRVETEIEQTRKEQELSTNLVALYKALGGEW